MKKRKTSLTVITCFCLLLYFTCMISGCAKRGSSEDSLKVFYLNSNRTGILSRMYEPESRTAQGQAGELLEQMALDYPGDRSKVLRFRTIRSRKTRSRSIVPRDTRIWRKSPRNSSGRQLSIQSAESKKLTRSRSASTEHCLWMSAETSP